MAHPRLTLKEIQAARNARRRRDMELAITEGRLVVRQMTNAERAAYDAGSYARAATQFHSQRTSRRSPGQ